MNRHNFTQESSEAIKDELLQVAVKRATDKFVDGRIKSFAEIPDGKALVKRAREIKRKTIEGLDRYLDELEKNVSCAGGVVHWASDADEARKIVVEIAKEKKIKSVVKSKSMTTEEIELNGALESVGVEVSETDLGDFVIQLAGERPSHLVAPMIHKTKEQTAELFSQEFGEEFPPLADAIAGQARKVLREKFKNADMGITGVNFAIAETGTVLVITNEGNARMTMTLPDVHVAIMGMEKVLPKLEDVPVFLKLVNRSATGQKMSIYVSFVTGPKAPDELDGAKEFHLIVMDNGRSQILGSPFRESLYCIRCGACLNVCPVYGKVGGHAYGGVYSGPIGSVLTPFYEGDEEFFELPHASSLCGACQDVCPVGIQIPRMLITWRNQLVKRKIASWGERFIFKLWAMGLSSSVLYRLGSWASRLLFDLFSQDGWIKRLPLPISGWTDKRDFPAFAKKPFRAMWKDIK